ncbi:MAG TPA: sugar ABC transporter permease [Thermomicrobiales bacterium]|nr:sugar ABC transporter permease [Thermomicrobiales bacterium]
MAVMRASPARVATPWLSWRRRRYLLAALFFLPAAVNFLVFRYIPIAFDLHASLHEYNLMRGLGAFVGLDKYAQAFHDALFWQSLKVSVLFAVLKVPAMVVLSILLALFVSRDARGMGPIRTVIYIPVVTSIVVVSVLWTMMYNKDLGLIQSVLALVGIPHIGFLSSATLALPALVVMMIWKEIGFSTIIFVAGLKGIPLEYYDAAAIDGATRFRQFWNITLPLLKPVTLFIVVTQSISSMQIFAPIFVMTQGGPAFSTNAIVYYIYQYGFQYSDMGYASAMSFILLVVLVAVSGVQFRLLRGDVEY